MRRHALDTNLCIASDRDAAFGEELSAFYDTCLPFTFFHAVVAQELLLGAVDVRGGAEIRRGSIRPLRGTASGDYPDVHGLGAKW